MTGSKPDALHRCTNCSRRLTDEQIVPLQQVPDLGQRLTPGSPVPSGECPHCRAFIYPDQTPLEQWYRTKAIQYFQDDDTRIDDAAGVLLTDHGAWVQAWLWLTDIGLTKPSGNGH